MSGRRVRSRRYHQSAASAGLEAAKRHIEEAQEFSREIGGTDHDVKAYFFGLQGSELEEILSEYGRSFGADKEAYARQTLPKWRAGVTKMSGLVAKRLFNLLPPRMPLGKKYELAENIWRHFGPSTSHSYRIGPDANPDLVAEAVAAKLDESVTIYNVPENVRNRFDWLAAGDIGIKEQLLNHFRQLEKKIALEKIRLELPVLQRQVRDHPLNTKFARTVLQVHKHEVSLWMDNAIGAEFSEGAPIKLPISTFDTSIPTGVIVIFVIIAITLILALIRR